MSAPLYKKKRVIKVTLETTKGTQVAGTGAVRVFDLDIDQARDHVDRSGPGLYRQPTETGTHGADKGTCSFKFLLRSAGSAAIDTGQVAVLQACGLKLTGAVLQVHSSHADDKALSIDVWEDGKKKTLFGAMGDVEFSGEVGGDLIVSCEFIGKYIEVDEAMPAWAPGTQTPMKLKSGAFTIGASSLLIGNYSLKMNNNVILRMDGSDATGILSAAIPSSDPEITCDPEDQLVADYDFDGIMAAGTTAAISLQVSDGTNTVTFAAAAVQTTDHKAGERDGVSIVNFTGKCISAVASDNAVVITPA